LKSQNKEANECDANDLELFFEELKASHVKQSTAELYAGAVQRFYDFYATRGTFETNPAAIALENIDINNNSSTIRRDISVKEMAEFIQRIQRPQPLAIVLLFVKIGIRLSELVNLDTRDIHLDHKAYKSTVDIRAELKDRPDTIYIPSNIREGYEYNGEIRETGNKRKRDTLVPIDKELKISLLRHFLTKIESPDADDERAVISGTAEPLFYRRIGYGSDRVIGERATTDQVWRLVTNLAKEQGWYRKGGGASENVTPHYFRHWFTTMAEQNRIERPIVKYIRGDVGDDVVDKHYRHFWGNEVKEKYLKNIYQFDLYN
jgi:integrase